jgi:nucleoside phosphorylase
LTCGFAGGLNPALPSGQVVFSTDDHTEIESALRAAGAQPARFHFADRIAMTAKEKAALRQATGADAVEMESQVVRNLCRERSISSATIRVILDTAAEDLPLDFNRLLTPDFRIHAGRLAATLLKSPGTIGVLIRFRKQTQAAAEKLAEALRGVVAGFGQGV